MPLLAHPGMTHRPPEPMGEMGQTVMQYLDDVRSGRIAEQGMRQYGDAARAGMAGDYGAFGGLLSDAMGGGFLAHGLLGIPGMIGKTVWHGSPHKWDVPDISKVGTGEGAQAYGHGFYSADADDVAAGYRIREGSRLRVEGRPISGNEGAAESIIAKHNGDIDAAIKEMDITKADSLAEGSVIGKIRADGADSVKEKLLDWKAKGSVLPPSEGYLYKLDIPDEDIAKYLDWDKPLSEQPESVRKALETAPELDRKKFSRMGYELGAPIRDEIYSKTPSLLKPFDEATIRLQTATDKGSAREAILDMVDAGAVAGADEAILRKLSDVAENITTFKFDLGGETGASAYKELARTAGRGLPNTGLPPTSPEAAASEYLKSLGIPGIRYLDGMSRGAGEGSSNYVTFDPSRIKVLERQ